MKQKEIGGKVYDVYTMRDWIEDGTLKIREGDLIEPEIYWELLNCLPPRSNGHYFQVGEAYSHDRNTGKALYQTFEDMGENYYLYVGLKN